MIFLRSPGTHLTFVGFSKWSARFRNSLASQQPRLGNLLYADGITLLRSVPGPTPSAEGSLKGCARGRGSGSSIPALLRHRHDDDPQIAEAHYVAWNSSCFEPAIYSLRKANSSQGLRPFLFSPSTAGHSDFQGAARTFV